MRYHIIAAALAVSLFSTGCGNSNNSFVLTSTGNTPALAETVVAEVYLGAPVEDATVRLLALDGSELARGSSNADGLVFFHNVNLPGDFRAVATLPDSNEEFRAEMRSFDHLNRRAHIDLLTTLVSDYMQANPGMAYAEAESRIKAAAAIPHAVDLSIGLHEPNPVFSSIAAWRAAGESGGWSTFAQDFLTRAEDGISTPYRLSRDQLYRPISGLEPALNQVAERDRVRTQQRLGIPDATPAQLQIRHAATPSLIAGPAGLAGQFLLGVSTGVAGNVATTALDDVLGWAANQLGMNYGNGDSQQLEEIYQQLAALTDLVQSTVDTATVQQVKDDIAAVDALFTNSNDPTLPSVRSSNLSLQQNLQNARATNQPFSPPPSISSVITDLQTPDYANVLTDANNLLLGPSNSPKGVVMEAQNVYYNQELGIDTPARFQNYPWRANAILNVLMPLTDHFLGYQNQALNLYSEKVHNYQVNPSPVAGIAAFQDDFRTTVANMKELRQQQPLYLSGGFIIDFESGIMWNDTMQDLETWSDANAAATTQPCQLIMPNGQVVNLSGSNGAWHLPNFGEYTNLANRGQYNPHYDTTVPAAGDDDYPDLGQATRGLPKLGFANVKARLDDSNSNDKDHGDNGDLWMSYLTNYNGFQSAKQWEFQLNEDAGKSGESKNTNNQSSSHKNPYMICRTFGPQVLVNPFVPANGAPSWVSGNNVPSSVAGKNFSNGEHAAYGLPTAITVSTETAPTSVSYPDPHDSSQTDTYTVPENSIIAYANITYEIQLGGAFSMGHGTTRSFNYGTPSPSTADVSTKDQGTGYPNELQQLVSWTSSDDDALEIFNVPYLSGIAIPRGTDPVTITATLLGAPGTSSNTKVTGSTDFTATEISPHTATSLQISPRNQIYGSNSNSQAANGSFPYYCTVFYADNTMEDHTTDVTWSVTTVDPSDPDYAPNTANAQIVVNSTGASLSLNQTAQTTPKAYNLQVNASYTDPSDPNNTVTDTTTIQIVPPVANP